MKKINVIVIGVIVGTLLFFSPGCRKTKNDNDRWGTVASNARIVYMAEVKINTLGARGYELVAMNLDGSNKHQLTDNEEQEFLPHFSPDGTQLVYTRYTNGGYGINNSQSRVTVYDFATATTRDLTTTGRDAYPVWSPDGSKIAFLRAGAGAFTLWVMNKDGSSPHEIGHPTGNDSDFVWGDIAWSSQNWILFVVGEKSGVGGSCFKARLDKIRPDGTQRTKVTDGGPNCTGAGLEQSGDADPGFSADGSTIYTSRGFPYSPSGMPGQTVRKLYAVSSDAWYQGKPERDLSLTTAPNCIEGVPKGSPDGKYILFFRACMAEQGGIALTDTAGTYRQWIANGFGPDWNPVWR